MLKCMIKIGLWRTRGNGQLWYGWEGEEVISHKGKQEGLGLGQGQHYILLLARIFLALEM